MHGQKNINLCILTFRRCWETAARAWYNLSYVKP